MAGRPKIRIPKAKDGYIARATIVKELTSYLEARNVPLAFNKARTAISDFKKHLKNKGQSDLILNASETGKELYPTQELVFWLHNRRYPYNGFSSPLCPFYISTVEVNNHNLGLTFSIGQVVATGASTYDELLEEMRILTADLVKKDEELKTANQLIQIYKEKEQKISARNSKNAKKKRAR